MLMCSNCKKRPAVVFITSVQGKEKKNEGLCLACAKERNIPQVAEYMEKFGISDEEIDQISEQMMEMLDGDSFEMGGSGLMPNLISGLFSDDSKPDENQDSSDKKGGFPFNMGNLFGAKDNSNTNNKKDKKSPKKKELRFLESYCTAETSPIIVTGFSISVPF